MLQFALLCMIISNERRNGNPPLPTTSLDIQLVCYPWMIPHAQMYHLNTFSRFYTPPTFVLSTQPCHIVQCPNTSDHFLIITYCSTTHSPHSAPPSPLPMSPHCCNTTPSPLPQDISFLHPQSSLASCTLGDVVAHMYLQGDFDSCKFQADCDLYHCQYSDDHHICSHHLVDWFLRGQRKVPLLLFGCLPLGDVYLHCRYPQYIPFFMVANRYLFVSLQVWCMRIPHFVKNDTQLWSYHLKYQVTYAPNCSWIVHLTDHYTWIGSLAEFSIG